MTISISNNKLKLPTTIPYVLLFLLLTFLCYEAHETFHHLVGGMLCGGFGTMTFTVYIPKPRCSLDDAVTLSGPFLSFAIAWFGAYWLTKHKNPLFAYTLIFASFAHLRFPLPLMGSGDEWLVARTNFELPSRFLLAGILFLLALPPLVVAYRTIANQQRVVVFAVSWLMPFVILFGAPYLDGWLLRSDAPRAVAGIPIVILLVDLVAVVLSVWIGKRVFSQVNQ